MNHQMRRDILRTVLSVGFWMAWPIVNVCVAGEQRQPREKLPVAAVVTAYYNASHADVIVGKILDGFEQNGGPGPDLRLVSLYTDQVPNSDISRDLAKKYGFRICSSIDDALTLGTDQIQVAGVLSIAEHGDYPRTADTKQKQYPRKRFFDEIAATFQRCGKVVPVFNDKHLSYRFDDALAMVETARRMKIPLMAGSVLPVTWRMPPIELPRDCEIEEALSIGYGGREDYGYHALETHQCMMERRLGGETGVSAVRAVEGDVLLKARSAGLWSNDLFVAALRHLPGLSQSTGEWKYRFLDGERPNSAAYLLEHRDGLRSSVIMANGIAGGFAFAVKIKGQDKPLATWFKLQDHTPFGNFAYLVHAIDEMVHTGKATYPVERTLLTTGILDRVMHSLANAGQRYPTPELAISYQGADWPFANHSKSHIALPSD